MQDCDQPYLRFLDCPRDDVDDEQMMDSSPIDASRILRFDGCIVGGCHASTLLCGAEIEESTFLLEATRIVKNCH